MSQASPRPGSYSASAYGLVRRAYNAPLTKDDVGTAGTLVESFITLPRKSRLIKFGVQSAASDVVMATSDGFELRTIAGAKLATLIFAADTTLGSGDATGAEPDTATSLAANTSYVCCVATAVGVSGSVFYFVDYVEEFDAETANA